MARVTTVNKSMKDQTCGRCGTALPKGSAYRWAKPGFRSRTRLIRCTAATCNFRQSELTTSNKSIAYAAQEEGYDSANAWDGEDESELESIRDAVVEGANECLEIYQEAQNSWADSCGGGENEEWNGYISELESWIDELEGVDFEAFEAENEDGEPEEDEQMEWANDQRQKLIDAIDALGL